MLKKRISDSIEKKLNEAIKKELDSAMLYRAMESWCECYGYFNAAKTFRKYSDEELKHMDKIREYLVDRNCKPSTPNSTDYTNTEFPGIVTVINKAYEHECIVTDNYRILSKLCLTDGDTVTFAFIEWYLKEQVEEENKFADLLQQANIMGLKDTEPCLTHLMFDKLIGGVA